MLFDVVPDSVVHLAYNTALSRGYRYDAESVILSTLSRRDAAHNAGKDDIVRRDISLPDPMSSLLDIIRKTNGLVKFALHWVGID
jgi:hypothetical protein